MSPFPHCSGRAVLNSPKHVPNWQLPSAPVPHRTHMFLRNGPHVCVSQVNVDVPNSPHLLPPESCRVVCRSAAAARARRRVPFSVFRLPPARPGTRERGTRGSRRPYSVDESSNRTKAVWKFTRSSFIIHEIHSEEKTRIESSVPYIVHWIKIEVSNEACRNTILHRMIEENVYKKWIVGNRPSRRRSRSIVTP